MRVGSTTSEMHLVVSPSAPVAGALSLNRAAGNEGDAGSIVPVGRLELQGSQLPNAAQHDRQHKPVQPPCLCKPELLLKGSTPTPTQACSLAFMDAISSKLVSSFSAADNETAQ